MRKSKRVVGFATVTAMMILRAGWMPAVAAHAAPPKPPRPRAPDIEIEAKTWLLSPQYVHRLDGEVDRAKLDELATRLEAAATPADKRKIQREIDHIHEAADDRREYALYGWTMQADHAGKPIAATRSMTGFILPATAENASAVKAIKPGSVIAIDRTDARDLFTVSGRRWFIAHRAAVMKNPPEMSAPGNFESPPDKPMTEAQKQSIVAALTYNHTKPREVGAGGDSGVGAGSGGELVRYTIKIDASDAGPPPAASSLHLWLAVHVRIDGGQGRKLGPILEHLEVPRGSKGGFTMSRSFEFITRPGVKIDGMATAIEPLALRWE